MQETQVIRVGFVGDVHYGPSANTKLGAAGRTLLGDVLSDLNDEHLDVLIDLGDRLTVTTRAEDLARLEQLAETFATSAHPRAHLMGNHDTYTLTATDNERILGTVASRVIQVGAYDIILFNPRLDVEQRMRFWLHDDDRDWLATTLASGDRPALVVSHVPLVQRSLDGNAYFERAWADGATYRNRHTARRLLESSTRVLAHVAGHVHWESLATVDGVHVLTVPSLTETFQTPHEAQRGHAVLELHPDRLTFDVRGLRRSRYDLPTRSRRHWINLDAPYGEQPRNLSPAFRNRFIAGRDGAHDPQPPEDGRPSHADELARVGWMYFVDQMTQQEIAHRLGAPRPRIVRLLQQAQHEGVVQIRINTRASGLMALEQQLRERFGLRAARVVPATNVGREHVAVGKAAAPEVARYLQRDATVAVAWGSTLAAMARELEVGTVRARRVVSSIGGLPQNSAIGPNGVTARLADTLDAESFVVNAPMFADDADMRTRITASPSVALVLDEATRADVWLVNAVDLTRLVDIQNLTFTHEVTEGMKVHDVVGLLGGYLIDSRGHLADHPLNQRLIAPPLAAMRAIPTTVLVAGGARKAAIIAAALRSGAVDVLITDADAARETIKLTAD